MATKRSSFFLAVLFIANPFVLMFYQNCSSTPNSHAKTKHINWGAKSPASEHETQTKVEAFSSYQK
jgi:hypothetical protein